MDTGPGFRTQAPRDLLRPVKIPIYPALHHFSVYALKTRTELSSFSIVGDDTLDNSCLGTVDPKTSGIAQAVRNQVFLDHVTPFITATVP
ncbi:hypothetical protein [Nocardia mexicana]|uniref:hypothetical protein n=1 Tax=Nocardia mexicana TaxID=279262 RepID=UPI0008312D04|nr:hypothetical protein [Nocardia mexicana]